MAFFYRFLAAIVFSGAVSGWRMAHADDPPPDVSPFYSTFEVPIDFMDVIGTEASGDPFSSPDEQPPPKPSPPTIWKEMPDFFEGGSVQDASSILVAAGIPWNPAGDVAFFHKEDQRLYVRSSREAAEMIDEFLGWGPPSPPRNIEIEILLIGLSDPAAYKTLAESDDARLAVESLTPDRARIAARASLLTRSGQRASIGQGRPLGAASAPLSPEPAPAERNNPQTAATRGEPGLSLQVEPTLGVDGRILDLAVDFTFGLSASPGDVAPLTGSVNTSLTVGSGRPVLQRLSLEGAPWPEVALVLTATVKPVDVDGWKNGVRQLLPREKQWRALGGQAAAEVGK